MIDLKQQAKQSEKTVLKEQIITLFQKEEPLSKFIHLDKMLELLDENNLGVYYLDNNYYMIAVDLGLFFNHQYNEKEFIYSENEQTLKELIRIIKKKETAICPTTYLFFTNIPFMHWLDENSLLDKLLKAHPHYNLLNLSTIEYSDKEIEENNDKRTYIFCSEVSKEVETRNYDFIKRHQLLQYYSYTIVRYPDLLEVFDDDRQPFIPMILPKDHPFKDRPDLFSKAVPITLKGMRLAKNSESHLYFISSFGDEVEAYLYKQIKWDDFFDLETSLDLLNVFDCLRPIRYTVNDYETVPEEAFTDEAHTKRDYQALFFYANVDKEYYNETKLECFKQRYSTDKIIYEDRMVADIYTVIPVRYDSKELLEQNKSKENNFVVNNIITGLNFQENFEFGNVNNNVRKFHDRLAQYDLGTINLLLTEEPHYNYYQKCDLELSYDKKVPVRLFLIIDKDTHSAVLNLVNLGVKHRPSKYLDEISRNTLIFEPTEDDKQYGFKPSQVIEQTFIDNDGQTSEKVHYEYIYLYKFIEQKFGLDVVSTPRSLILSPYLNDDKKNDPLITKQYHEIIGSLLYGKSYYTDEEELGKLVTKDLDHIFESDYGDAVYDYAVLQQSRVAVLQYERTYKDYIVERIDFAVVSLFYMELIQMEDAAIGIANKTVSKFINDYELDDINDDTNKHKKVNPNFVFDTIDELQEEFTKTLDFRNVRGNYHTTNIAYNSMRNAFGIDEHRQKFEQNRAEVLTIYQTIQTANEQKSNKIQSIFMLVFTLTTVYDALAGLVDNEHVSIFKRLASFISDLVTDLTYVGFVIIVIIGEIIYLLLKKWKNKKEKQNYNKKQTKDS